MMNTLEQKNRAGLAPTALVFDRQRRESSKAFAAFKTYLDLGPDRTHAVVAEKIGVSTRMVHKWSAKYGWVERVAARDAYIAEVERLAIERVAVEHAVEWWKLHEPTRRLAWLKSPHILAGRLENIDGLFASFEIGERNCVDGI